MGSPLLNEALSSASRAVRDKKGVLVRSKKTKRFENYAFKRKVNFPFQQNALKASVILNSLVMPLSTMELLF